ncbi:hypothetical protein PO909_010703 [Leuciscus waleckii]
MAKLTWSFPSLPEEPQQPDVPFELPYPVPANSVAAQCGENSVYVEVMKDFFGTGHPVLSSGFTLGGCTATGEDSSAQVLIFESELHGCSGTSMVTEDELVYRFNIIYTPQEASYGVPIVRSSGAVVGIECHYPRTHNVSSDALMPTWIPYSSTKVAEEVFVFSLKLMTDDWRFERPSNQYFLGDMINLEASVRLYSHVPVRVFVDSCVATAVPDVASVPRYSFIENNGCLVDAKLTGSTSSFMPRTQGDKLGFQLEAFRFQQADSGLMTRAKPEDDEYWNSSKFKAFTFDDDDDEFSRLKESKRAVNSILVGDYDDDDDEDDVERVSWTGEPVGTRSKPGAFQSFSESFSDTSTRTYAPELRKPRSDGKDFVSDLSPEETVRRMQKGRAFSLEKFRSLQDKLLLLDEAVAVYDGNVITAVLIYLKRSLSKEILFRELMARDVALRHYVHYLKEMGEQKLLVELLNLPFSHDDATLVQDHYTLLERQIIIEASDKKADADIFKKFPRKASILNMPIITTLYYSCFYHYGESEGTFSSPSNIRKTFRIAEKQYILTALGARAKLKSWFDVDSLFNTKNWLGYTKKRSPIGFHRVVDILQKNSAPVQVLQEYVNLIDDTELKLSVALKYKCHDIIINTYRDLKDRQQLTVYGEKLERGSVEHRKIQELLNSGQIRWKN